MTYTAPTSNFLKKKPGTDSSIIAAQLALIGTELDTLTTANGKAAVNIVDLTASMVSGTSLAANGVDVANTADTTYYAVFCAPVACTIVCMDTIITEAYLKETTDAKIELVTDAASPVTKVTYTLPEAGRAIRTMVSTTPTDAALAAGTILNLKITMTGNSTGTGHAKVIMRYTVD